MVGESASIDTEAAHRFHKIVEEDNYIAEQVYNVDEFALYRNKMPGRPYIAKNETSVTGFKASKVRITLFLCSNATGEHLIKQKLINHTLN
ncbi:tigger transposable element-derived protein 1 [Caerostris darwini]|uniref:Tigger transposable element-derived protein 1 n=1 Tax=Caerostris darwini TaxID=1538125 RepID=A0AAV4PBV8_9ARAC|nr:tigger transposable element-derived protein 1 [Caerostris darwini]